MSDSEYSEEEQDERFQLDSNNSDQEMENQSENSEEDEEDIINNSDTNTNAQEGDKKSKKKLSKMVKEAKQYSDQLAKRGVVSYFKYTVFNFNSIFYQRFTCQEYLLS